MLLRAITRAVSLPRALILILALLQAGGVIELVRRATCEVECRSDGCDNDCTPDRDAPQCPCHCQSVTATRPAAIDVVVEAPATPAAEIRFAAADQLRPSPDPREILHVPRSHAV